MGAQQSEYKSSALDLEASANRIQYRPNVTKGWYISATLLTLVLLLSWSCILNPWKPCTNVIQRCSLTDNLNENDNATVVGWSWSGYHLPGCSGTPRFSNSQGHAIWGCKSIDLAANKIRYAAWSPGPGNNFRLCLYSTLDCDKSKSGLTEIVDSTYCSQVSGVAQSYKVIPLQNLCPKYPGKVETLDDRFSEAWSAESEGRSVCR